MPHSFRCTNLRTKCSLHPLVLSPLQQCHAMHGHGTAWRALHSGSDEQHGGRRDRSKGRGTAGWGTNGREGAEDGARSQRG